MCGIAGFLDPTRDGQALEAMLEAIAHRGPDGEGRYRDGALHMGMRRLAVIDPAGGAQPLAARGGRVVVFQNGEIYNYRALRRELEATGVAFRTDSDTEVIAEGYAAWGIARLLERLDGMFALAILDREARALHLVRDRLGEKPLFYARPSDGSARFAYASSVVALAAMPWLADDIDPLALERYLALHFVPGDGTIFAQVRRVLPGERLILDLQSAAVRRVRYYRPSLERAAAVSDDELAESLGHAVRSRMVADVPVGLFLSGGLDSSVVAALAAREHPRIDTLSIGFADRAADETAHAEAVARHVGSTHHHFRFDSDGFARLLPEVAAALDEPLGDQAALPLYWLSREARRHVTVVLSGEGADEVFAGYDYYRRNVVPTGWRQRVASLLGGARQGADSLIDDGTMATASGFPLLTAAAERAALTGRPTAPADDWERDVLAWLDESDEPLQRATAAEIATWLPDDLLVKLDRMTMAHGLEGRAPYLDPHVVALGLGLPPAERMAGGDGKVALRRIASRWLPAEIVARPKHGFVLPMARWLAAWFAAHGGPATYFRARPFPALDQSRLVSLVERDLAGGLRRERLLLALVMLVEWRQAATARWAVVRRRAAGARQFDSAAE